MAIAGAGIPAVINGINLIGDIINVRNYGARGDGVTNDAAAFQAALNAAPYGGIVYVPLTAEGYLIGGFSLTIPHGVSLIGDGIGRKVRWPAGIGVALTTPPGGTMLKITDTANSPIKMGNNCTVAGFTFWYPNQNWDIVSLAESFVTYPATIVLGIAAGAAWEQYIYDCVVLGATSFVEQFDTNGNAVNALHVSGISGTVVGTFAKINVSSDPIRFSHINLNSTYGAAFVGDGTVGGDTIIFRTKVAQNAKFAEFGLCGDIDVTNVMVFGMKNFVHYKANTHVGDSNQDSGGRYTNCIMDVVYQAFRIERDGSTSALSLNNCRIAPIFRPNGVAGDSATQCVISFKAGVATVRVNMTNVYQHASSLSIFSAGYTGVPDRAFIADGALGANCNIIGSGNYLNALNTTDIADANVYGIVRLGNYVRSDTIVLRSRWEVDGWAQLNVPASQTNVQLSRYGNAVGVPSSWIAKRSGFITALWVKSNENRIAGACTVVVFKNGVGQNPGVQLNTGNLNFDSTLPLPGTISFVLSDVLDLRVTTDGAWSPTTADITAGFEIEG